MKIIFCNIAYLNFYDGRVAGELKPTTGGRWVKENEDAHEKWNFLNYDGKCYGYVQTNGEQMHIERYDKVTKSHEETDQMTVIWCAEHPTKGTVIIGWYENATIYRYRQSSKCTPVTGIDRDYWFKTEAENAYLMPENNRTFSVGRASVTGTGTGFGRENIWYAESNFAKGNLIPEVLEYIKENREKRINTLTETFFQPDELSILTEKEISEYAAMEEETNHKTLGYAYRNYANNLDADAAYDVARSLMELFQFRLALPWFEKVVELDPNDSSTKGNLIYLYQQCEEYEKSIALAKEMLNDVNAGDTDIIEELYSVLADNYYIKGDTDTAIDWLDKIIKESKKKDLVEFTKNIRVSWSSK